MKNSSSSVSKKMFTPIFKVNTKVDLMSIRSKEDYFQSLMDSVSPTRDNKTRFDSNYFSDLSRSITERSTYFGNKKIATPRKPQIPKLKMLTTEYGGFQLNSQRTEPNQVLSPRTTRYPLKRADKTLTKFLPSMEVRATIHETRAQSPSDGNILNKNLHHFYSHEDDEFTPQQNMLKCSTERPPHGQVPVFNNGSYTWVDVRVLDFKDGKYIVSQIPDGKLRQVQLLSICFKWMNRSRYEKRITECKRLQRIALEEQRFMEYVDQVADTAINMQAQRKNKFINYEHFTDFNFKMQTKAKQLTAEIQQLYVRCMKKCVVEFEMSENPSKFKPLKIKLRTGAKKYPKYGFTLGPQIKNWNLDQLRYKFRNEYMPCRRQVVLTNRKLYQVLHQYVNYTMINVGALKLVFPIQLGDLDEQIDALQRTGNELIQIKWRDKIVSDIQDILKDVYRFYVPYEEEYVNTELERFVIKVEMMFTDAVTITLKHSLDQYLFFLRRFSLTDISDSYKVQVGGLICIHITVSNPQAKAKPNKPAKGNDMRKTVLGDKTVFDEILQQVHLDPSLQQIKQVLLTPLDLMIDTIQRTYKLSKDLTPLLKRDPLPAVEPGAIAKEYQDLVTEMVTKEYEQAVELCNKFRQYQYLLEPLSSKNLVKIFGSDLRDKPTINSINEDGIWEAIDKLIDAEKEIRSLALDEFVTGLFRITTRKGKDILISKAIESREYILGKSLEIVQWNLQKITQTYQELFNRTNTIPKNERELMELKSFIEEREIILSKLEFEVSTLDRFLDMFSSYYYSYETKLTEEFFRLMEWPEKIRASIKESAKSISHQEAKFMDNLYDEKIAFDRVLNETLDNFEKIQGFNDYKKIKDCVISVSQLNEQLGDLAEQVKSFNERESLFKLPISKYTELTQLNKDFQPYLRLWNLANEFEMEKDLIMNGSFMKLNSGNIVKKITLLLQESARLSKTFQDVDDENAQTVTRALRKDIDDLRSIIWVVECLTIEAFQKKISNWKEILRECRIKDLEPNDSMSFNQLIAKEILSQRDIIEELSRKIEKCWNMEKKLNEMIDKMREVHIELAPYKNSGTYVFKSLEEVQQQMDEQLNALMMMKASQYIKAILGKANQLEYKIVLLQDTLENGIKCQRTWMYLEPIFSSDDIKKKLAVEKQKFDLVDKNWRMLIEIFYKEPYLWDAIESDKMKNEFDHCNRILDQITKSLSEYLETKRKFFPRFYFLSDEELLEILAQTKDPSTVQKHIGKCFEAINFLHFSPNQEVTAIESQQKEVIQLLKAVDVNEGEKKGNIERWLSEIEMNMQTTMRDLSNKTIKDIGPPRTEWMLSWPAQCILAINMVRWTRQAENAVLGWGHGTDKFDLKVYENQLKEQLVQTVDLVRKDLTVLQRITLGSLVVIDVHAKDVISQLARDGCKSISEFNWISQLRYYYDDNIEELKDIQIQVRMVTAEIYYRFEYLGNTNRLVITPLTDRCYRTLIGAFHLNYGGAPEGPAGTGKTETVKDLAKAIAVQCVVFNCSDGLNYLAMSKFFKGLSSSGAWCSFDEFNRIDPEVLSVIAQQIFTIQTAIKDKKQTFMFDGDEIRLVPSCAINITMNPGYVGRSELPDNLKILFRPCAMMVPDYAMIAEIYLYSVGYQNARELSIKIVASMRLCTEQLSPQDHYDFGMRALKAILTCAGTLKRTFTEHSEDVICLMALLNVNLPKFTVTDTPLFLSITKDLFPDVSLPRTDYTLLREGIVHICAESNLQAEQPFLDKCFQLEETINVRHGLMCVGAAFSGKSKVTDTLAQAKSYLKTKGKLTDGVQVHKLNPKSITSDQLYGKLDSDTKQWSDGVAAIIMRECNRNDTNNKQWILFDGPVDALWIENLNTVLDDNKKLCLTSGEIIKISSEISILFEVQDLSFASPATVSRCGMVYFESKQLGWKPLVKSIINTMPQCLRDLDILPRVHGLIEGCVAWSNKYGSHQVHKCELTMVNTLLNYWKGMLSIWEDESLRVPEFFLELVMQALVFSVIWSIGGAMDESCRKQFSDFLHRCLQGANLSKNYGLDVGDTHQKPFPSKGFDNRYVFDLLYDLPQNQWVQWTDTQPPFSVPQNTPYHKLLIPTNDSIRCNHFIKFGVGNKVHLLVCGPTGTGKTVNVVNQLNINYYNNIYTNLQTVFSGQTTANQIQKVIESKVCVRRRKGYFGPEDGKSHIVIFIDDLNMPAKEKYGAQPPIELLRQWMDYGGWYDLETREFKYLQDITFVAAMLPPGGGRNSISMRYLRHYALLYLEPFQNESLVRIFSNIMDWFYESCTPSLNKQMESMKDSIVRATIWIYNQVSTVKELLPTPAKAHYIYNLRDISKIFLGISKGSSISLISVISFIKLWSHECLRVFSDRMINNEDQSFFEQLLARIIRTEWNKDWSEVMGENELLLWTTIVPSIHPENKKIYQDVYNEVQGFTEVKAKCQEYLDDYNNLYQQAQMQLVLFLNAIQHINRIVRIMQTMYGHALLIGMGGTGRSSLSRLSSFIALQSQPVTIDQRNWTEELQKLLRSVGIEGKITSVSFQDTQFSKESMVEEICNLLNNGEIPDLFPQEEKAKIIEEMTTSTTQQANTSHNEKYQNFVERCRLNLHLIICMQPVGEQFRRRLRNFPALVNCTTIDWFQSWPEEALSSTAQSFLSTHYESTVAQGIRDGLTTVAVEAHIKVCEVTQQFYQELRKHFYVTPTQYLQLLSTYKRLFDQQKDRVRVQIDRYETGVEKIKHTEKDVEQMRQVLFALQPKLEKSTQENLQLLNNLQKKQQEADLQKQQCEKEELECSHKRVEANQLRNDCQMALDNVLPLLAQAAEALDKITKDDMTQLKSFTNPPPSAAIVMEGLCYAFAEDGNVKAKERGPPTIGDFWEYSKRFLLNDKLIKRVKDFKIEQIRAMLPQKVAKLKQFNQNPLFEKDKVFNASKAAGNLSLWIRSVLETYEALMIIEPKKAELAEAEQNLIRAEQVVVEKQMALEQVLKLLQALQSEYDVAQKEKEQITAQVRECETQLERAEKLTNGLATEKTSWIKKATEFHAQAVCIYGDCILASAFISYMGVFTSYYREQCLQFWKDKLALLGIKYSQDFSLQTMLSDAMKVSQWTNIEKLPNDSFSIDNAIILKNSTRWPLMIDPQLQGYIWIKKMEAKRNLATLRPSMSAQDITMILENAITIGYPVLLEVSQTIDQIYEPILQQRMVKQGNSWKLRFGDKILDYQKDFKFYMTTKLSNPHYPPQVCVMVTILNFQVTLEGLEDQMLNIVVKMDEPVKEELRVKNIKEFFENKNKQKATEDQILKLLYEAKGDLLQDEVLINALQKSKSEGQEIEERISKQEQDREMFNIIRANYKEAAKRVSNLYFVVLDLASLEPTYFWSLEFYIQLYEKAIKESSHSKDFRSRNIIDKFQHLLYSTVCRSLLEKDKFLFSFLLCLKIMQTEGKVTIPQVRFSVVGTTLTEPPSKVPELKWMTKKIWCGVCDLTNKFPELYSWLESSFSVNLQFWDQFYFHASPQDLELPFKVPEGFHLFHKAIIVKLIRPDKFIRVLQQIVVNEMGKSYLEPPPFSMETSFKESDHLTPLIFILSPGADPRQEITQIAEKMNNLNQLVALSLGQGQQQLAEKQIRRGVQQGLWILLQNCHVAHSFMPTLELLFEMITNGDLDVHRGFRLWLTSMPSSVFPHNIITKGLKMTYEPPRGLRNNLLRSYTNLDQNMLDDCRRPKDWKTLLFSLSFFHAILLERRKYGPLGWNIPYAFTSADLDISKMQLKQFLDKYTEIPWDALQYLVAETNYGGRVTDPQDRRLIRVILADYYNPEALKPKYHFSESPIYYIPSNTGNLENYIEYIRNLPLNDTATIFGMHPNAEIYSAVLEHNMLCQVILTLLPRVTNDSNSSNKMGSSDHQVKQRSIGILEMLPKLFDIVKVNQKYPMLGKESLNTVLQQELIRYNKLVETIQTSLGDLVKAIDGLVVMTSDLDEIYNKVFDNQVAEQWKKYSYPSLKPLGSWIQDLIERLKFLQRWIDRGVPNQFWISGFFFTQSFLTGVLQNYSRKHKIAIDKLRFSFKVLPKYFEDQDRTFKLIDGKVVDVDMAPPDGCYIHGLYLDGARWSNEKEELIEPETNVLFYTFPYIWLLPTSDHTRVSDDSIYECPIYKTSLRKGTLSTTGHSTNFIIEVDIPIDPYLGQKHWIKRGVALLTQLDE